MMPFSVLRIWGTGLLSWAILIGGIYCIYEWADGIDPPTVEHVTRDPETGETRVETVRIPDDERDTQGGWPYLAAGIALLALSCGGFLPVTLLLGQPGSDTHTVELPEQTQIVERPDGTRLHVALVGPNTSPTLVFVHGWSLDRSAWKYVKRDLGGRYRLVLMDLPGLGDSKGPESGDYSLEKMAQDVKAVIDHQEAGPIILIGHSIGGMLTQTFCRLFPQQLGPRVAGLVLVHTTYTNPLRTAFLAPLWTAIETPILVPLNHLTVWLAPLAWLSNWQSYMNGSLHMMTRFASFAGGQTWGQLQHGALQAAKSWPGVVARGNLAMLNFDEQATLPKIEIPVLVIGAKHDRMTKVEASERIEQLLPNARYATVDAGHLGYWEQHSAVSELIGEFAEGFHAAPPIPEWKQQAAS